jgi:hypothetical protein
VEPRNTPWPKWQLNAHNTTRACRGACIPKFEKVCPANVSCPTPPSEDVTRSNTHHFPWQAGGLLLCPDPTKESTLRSTLLVPTLPSAVPGCLPEEGVCSVSFTAACVPDARTGGTGANDARRDAVGPAWKVDAAPPGAVLPRPCAQGEQGPPLLPPAAHRSRNAEREPPRSSEVDCARGRRSFVDVLECLM